MERAVIVVLIVGALGLASAGLFFLRLGGGPGPGPVPVVEQGGGAVVEVDGATAFDFDPARPLEPSPALAGYGLRVPEFDLIDQDGNAVDEGVLEGHATVVSFIFTHCVLICPTMTARMYGVYDGVEGTGARFVSISVDPEHDTPERLRQYASGFGIDHARWKFLTGDGELVRSLVRESLRFEVAEDTAAANRIALPDGSTMSNILHPSRLILVGPDRSVIGLYSPSIDEDMEELVARLRAIGG